VGFAHTHPLFLKKAGQKTLIFRSLWRTTSLKLKHVIVKVFCFFFSKKEVSVSKAHGLKQKSTFRKGDT